MICEGCFAGNHCNGSVKGCACPKHPRGYCDPSEPVIAHVDQQRHVLVGDLNWLEYAIADYVAKWGAHFTGQPYMGEFGVNVAGIPTGVANMAMTVIRKNIVGSWTEDVTVDMTVPLGRTSDV